jgi:hypothetical protein
MLILYGIVRNAEKHDLYSKGLLTKTFLQFSVFFHEIKKSTLCMVRFCLLNKCSMNECLLNNNNNNNNNNNIKQ